MPSKNIPALCFKGALFLSAVFLLMGCGEKTSIPSEESVRQQLGDLSLSFQENKGQVDEVVKYLVKNGPTTIFFTPEEVVYNMVQREVKDDVMNADKRRGPESRGREEVKGYVIRQSFVDANKAPAISSSEKQQGTVNYMIGDDESKWVKGANTFGKIRYEELYEGIDLEYTGENSALKYAFIVSPETDYNNIQVKLAGVDSLEVDGEGNLVMKNSFGNVLLEKPFTFQEVNGKQKEVESQYIVLSNDTYSFQVGDYDVSLPLVIDPRLVWASYWGKAGTDEIYGMDIDDDGNVYVTGVTSSTSWSGLPGGNSYFDTTHNGGNDVFVTKFNPTATSPVFYFTYLGGTGSDSANGIAVNSLGQAYVAGSTISGYPIIGGSYDTVANGGTDGFISRLSADGTQLLASTYFGGQNNELIHGIAIDGNDDVYIAGQTDSAESSTPAFPLINSYDATANGGGDGFYAKFNDSLSILAISSFIGGSGSDIVRGIDVDSTGRIYLAGESASTDFPFVNAYQAVDTTGIDAFIARISSGGTGLQYSSFLGAAGLDRAYDVATTGADGMAAITGSTTSAVFNTKNPLDSTLGGSQDGFAALFDTSASGSLSLIYSTYLGGSDIDLFRSVDIDTTQNVYVLGDTASTDYPTSSEALFTNYKGSGDIVLSKLSPLGDELLYSTYVRATSSGATATDTGYALVVNDAGRAYGAGRTGSNGMASTGVIQTVKSTGVDGNFFQISTVNEAPLEPVLNAPSDGANVYDTTPSLSARYRDLDTNDLGTVDFRVATGSASNCLNGVSLVSSGTSAESASTSQIMYFNTGVLGNGAYYWCAQNDDGVLTSGTGYTSMGSFTIATSVEFLSSTYLGGGLNEVSAGIGFDTSGNPIVMGSTVSTDYPTTVGAYQETYGGSETVVVTKLHPALTSVLISTYVGGATGSDSARHGKVDDNGKVYVSGYSTSSSLPAGSVLAGFDTAADASGDVFLFVLNESLTSVLYSTFVGTGDYDDNGGLAIHPTSGRVLLTGYTYDPGLPVTAGAFDTAPDLNFNGDGFATFVDTTQSGASSHLYTTYLGGTGSEWMYYPAMDSAGMGYVVGDTSSADFPGITAGAFKTTINAIEDDGFLVKIDPTGNSTTSLVYGTFLSQPNEAMTGFSVALDGSNVFVCGQNFNELSSERDVGIFKMNLGGNGASDLLASAVIGGDAATDYCYDVIVDDNGDVTFSARGGSDYPTTAGAFDETFNSASGQNLVLSKLNPALDTILYSTFFDGDDGSGGTDSYASGLAFHSSGILYMAGGTNVPNFPAMGGFDSSLGETGTSSDIYVAKFDLPASAGGGASVPDAVTNLNATAGDSQVSLTWSAPADNGSAITDYVVQYGATAGFPGNAVTFNDGASASTGATVTGLTNDTEYSFHVAAVNGEGQAAYSNVDTATPIAGAVPTVPQSTVNISVEEFLSFSITNAAIADEAAGDQPFGTGTEILSLSNQSAHTYSITGENGTPLYTELQITTNSSDGYQVSLYADATDSRTSALLRTGGSPADPADHITDTVATLAAIQAVNDTLVPGTDTGIAFRLVRTGTSVDIYGNDEITQWGDNDTTNALWASPPLGAARPIFSTTQFNSNPMTALINWFIGVDVQQRAGVYSGQVFVSAAAN